MGNDAICLEKQGECGAMADAMPVASVAGGDSLIDRLDALESEFKELDRKFDVWYDLVEPLLANAQIAIGYDSNLIAVLGIVFAVVAAGITYWLTKRKEDAIDEAVKKLDDSLSKGILKEGSKARSKIIDSIINTDEFKEKVVNILDKYSTFASKSSYDNVEDIDKAGETTLDSESLKKTDTNDEG